MKPKKYLVNTLSVFIYMYLMYLSRQTCIYKLTRKGEKSKNIARDILKIIISNEYCRT